MLPEWTWAWLAACRGYPLTHPSAHTLDALRTGASHPQATGPERPCLPGKAAEWLGARVGRELCRQVPVLGLLTVIPTKGSSLQCSRANNSSNRPARRPRPWTHRRRTEARTDLSATSASDCAVTPHSAGRPAQLPTQAPGPLSSPEARASPSGCLSGRGTLS